MDNNLSHQDTINTLKEIKSQLINVYSNLKIDEKHYLKLSIEHLKVSIERLEKEENKTKWQINQ